MYSILRSPSVKTRGAFVALAVLSLSACSSPEERAKSYYEHGLQLLAAHDNDRAEVEFRNAVKYNKNLLPAWQSLAQVEEAKHNWSALASALHSILELDPKDMATRIKLGRLLLVGGALDDALRLVNDVKDPDAQNADLLTLKAGILFKLKDSAGAVKEAQAALKIDPANTGAMFILASDDFGRGDAKGALAILNNEAMSKRDDLGVSLFKLQIFEKTQDLQAAEDLLKKMIERQPKEVGFKRELIKLYLSQHRNDDAETVQRSIVALDPSNVQAQLDLIRLLNATKGPAAAEQALAALISAGGDVFPYQIATAQFDFAQGKSADGIALLKKLISDASSPEHVLSAQLDLAQVYLSQKQTEAAEALVSEILSKDARNTGGLKLRAAIRMSRNQFEEAISDLRQALNDQPRATDLMLMLAMAYERSGSVDLAEKEFADAMRVSNFNPVISLNYVSFLQRRGSLAHAEDVLTDLASRSPKNIQVLSALAQVRLARKEWTAAQEVAETIKGLGTDKTEADELIGAALAGQNKFDQSISAFQEAYQSAPAAVQPMYALVRTYLNANKNDQAVDFLQSVLKANPSNAEAYVLLGSVQIINKAPDQARQSFMTAIEKQPKDLVGYRALSNLYILQNNNDEALKVIRAGLQQQPDNPTLHLTLAAILERTGDYEAAITEYEGLLAKDPSSIVVANNLASLLADHRTDKASLDRAQALAAGLQKSTLPQFKDTQGWVSYRQGDYKTALPLLEDAGKALPKDPTVQYHLGMAYAAVSQPDKAAEQLKMAAGLAPDHDLDAKIQAALAKTATR